MLRDLSKPGPGTAAERLERLALELLSHYQLLRMTRAAADLARTAPKVAQWNYERTRTAVAAAHAEWANTRDAVCRGEGPTPYVPAVAPPRGLRNLQRTKSWPWGIAVLDQLANAALDLLKRLVWVLPTGPKYEDAAGCGSA